MAASFGQVSCQCALPDAARALHKPLYLADLCKGGQAEVEAVLEQVYREQVLERLSPYLDATDWALLQGLAEGKTQAEVARELGLSQSTVSERLGRIRRKARSILPDFGDESR